MISKSIDRRNQIQGERKDSAEDQIERLEEDIRRLKIDFEIYFNGGSKTPPHAARAGLEARISRLNGDRGLSYGSRYKLNTLLSRYNSYRQLWRRRLKDKGEEIY